jgi:ABC-type Mn2+/Zn2+ transport system ATPase subunit
MAYLRSYALQSHPYWMAYSVEEIIRMGHDRVSSERFKYLCNALDIESFLHQKITELSGGQLQRVEIARAFMRDTTLVLLDEPFASQDVQSISRMIELFKSEQKRGVTLVIVAHGRRDELTWCDDVISLPD